MNNTTNKKLDIDKTNGKSKIQTRNQRSTLYFIVMKFGLINEKKAGVHLPHEMYS